MSAVVILAKPEAIEVSADLQTCSRKSTDMVIFSSTVTIEKAWFYNWFQMFLGTGLINSGGNLWRFRRRLLNSCFRKDILKGHLSIMNEKSLILVESLKKETREDFTKVKKPISECTLNIIHDIIFGRHEDENKSELRGLINSIKWGMRFVVERVMNGFLWPHFIYFSTKRGKELKKHEKIVKDFTRSRIQQRKQKLMERNFSTREANETPLLDLLLEYHFKSTDFTENDLSDELITMVIAGQDSTTVAISWILYMLGLHEDIQTKVYEELDLIFDGDCERHVTLEELKEMKYLKSVIKETLRLYPPAPFMARQVHKDVNICGYQIPKGTTCVVLPPMLHRDEETFPDAERFDPDRFSPENSQGRSPYAYIPFSAGPRNCIVTNQVILEDALSGRSLCDKTGQENSEH
ncbi:unnamed protein product [Larinioides sclopetarius]|uniref:Cytochrome P450 n=3 Tax=Larinioides sclopetarius TaxID=280406 RepID=A0AAV1ZK13_9ARAC